VSRGPRPGGWGEATRYAGAGLELTSAVVGGLVLGIWLDRWLGTAPWLALACLLLGAVGGFVQLFRRLRAWQRRDEEDRPST
jgi:ATP synthase protein I